MQEIIAPEPVVTARYYEAAPSSRYEQHHLPQCPGCGGHYTRRLDAGRRLCVDCGTTMGFVAGFATWKITALANSPAETDTPLESKANRPSEAVSAFPEMEATHG